MSTSSARAGVILTVTSLDDAVVFYQHVAAAVLERREEHFVSLQCGAMALHFVQGEPTVPTSRVTLSLPVADLTNAARG